MRVLNAEIETNKLSYVGDGFVVKRHRKCAPISEIVCTRRTKSYHIKTGANVRKLATIFTIPCTSEMLAGNIFLWYLFHQDSVKLLRDSVNGCSKLQHIDALCRPSHVAHTLNEPIHVEPPVT